MAVQAILHKVVTSAIASVAVVVLQCFNLRAEAAFVAPLASEPSPRRHVVVRLAEEAL